LVKDANEKLKSKEDTTGKIRIHKIFVDSKTIQILYMGERKNAEYLADAKGNFIKLEIN
jgi:hypothetical protein